MNKQLTRKEAEIHQYKQRASKLRVALNLDAGIWKHFPDELLLSAFVPRSNNAPQALRDALKYEYGTKDNEVDEFLGDAVLELLVTEAVLAIEGVNEGTGTKLRQEIVQNVTLDCFMRGKDLCDRIYTTHFGKKTCANTFEALIGALWYWIRSEQIPNAYEEMKRWFIATWRVDEIVQKLKASGSVDCQLTKQSKPLPTNPFPCSVPQEVTPKLQSKPLSKAKSPIKKSPIKKSPPRRASPDVPKAIKKPKSPQVAAQPLPKPSSRSPVREKKQKPKSPQPIQPIQRLPSPKRSPAKKSPAKKISESRIQQSYSQSQQKLLEKYQKMLVVELRKLATGKSIPWRNLRKAELIEELMMRV